MYLPQSPLQFDTSPGLRFARAARIAGVHKPHPHPKRSALREAIAAAGPAPGRNASLSLFMVVGMVFGLTGILTSAFPLVLLAARAPLIGFSLLGIILFAAIWGIRRALSYRKRIQQAWDNNWLVFYPALVGNLVKRGSETSNGKTTYMYSTCLMVLRPDGGTDIVEGLSATGLPSPAQLESSGACLAGYSEELRVDFEHNNGWTLYAVIDGAPIDSGTIGHGLTHEQIAAALTVAERDWVPRFMN